MRVLHLLPNLRREGAQVFVHNLVTCAGAENAEYVVCAWQQGGALLEAFQRGAVPAFVPARTHRFSTPWRTLGFIDEVIAGNEIHLIHAHMPDAAVWGWFAAKRRGLPLLITYHSNKLLARSNPVWSCVRFFSLPLAARYAQCNIAISASIGERVRRSLALPSTRVCIVPNGVQIPAWNAGETIRERNSTSACIVAVGRLVELKSHEQLIRAASKCTLPHCR